MTGSCKLTSISLTQQLENSHVASGTIPLDRVSMELFGKEFLLGATDGIFCKDARDGSRIEIISNGVIRYVGFISDADSVDDYGNQCVRVTAVGRVADLFHHGIPPTFLAPGERICTRRGGDSTAIEKLANPPAGLVNSADLGVLSVEAGLDDFLTNPLEIADPAQLLGRSNLRDALRDILRVLDAAAIETVDGIHIQRLGDTITGGDRNPVLVIRDEDIADQSALSIRQQVGREATEIQVDYGAGDPFILQADASQRRRGLFRREIDAKFLGSRSIAAEVAAFHLERRRFPSYEVTMKLRGVRSVSVLDIVELAIDGTELAPAYDKGWRYDAGVPYGEAEFPHLYGSGYVSKRTLNLSNDVTTLTVRKSVGIV